MKCKFCGCTEDKACLIPIAVESDGAIGLVYDSAIARSVISCDWLLDDVCSAPACVEKAYTEARPLAEQVDQALRVEWGEVA